MQRNVV